MSKAVIFDFDGTIADTSLIHEKAFKKVFEPFWLIYSFVVSVLLFFIGVKIFNKVEKSFIDTV